MPPPSLPRSTATAQDTWTAPRSATCCSAPWALRRPPATSTSSSSTLTPTAYAPAASTAAPAPPLVHPGAAQDGKVSEAEFAAGLRKVADHLRHEIPTNTTKHTAPVRAPGSPPPPPPAPAAHSASAAQAWMQRSAPRVVGAEVESSTAQRDVGGQGVDPRRRQVVDSVGTAGTTKVLPYPVAGAGARAVRGSRSPLARRRSWRSGQQSTRAIPRATAVSCPR